MYAKKILGIIGGMGPQATCYMFSKIIEHTKAEQDQDHIEIIIHNNTRIPDRTEAIVNGETSPLPEMLRSARIVEEAGAEIIIIPCITAHYYIEWLQEKVGVQIIDAVEETVSYIQANNPNVQRIGLLATTGTIRCGMFQKRLRSHNLDAILIPDRYQKSLVMEAIYGERGIKAGFYDELPKTKLMAAIKYLVNNDAEGVIAGCTEIPLVIRQEEITIPLVEPMEILAESAIRACLTV